MTTQAAAPEGLVEALNRLRTPPSPIQRLGAAISNRNWHEAEQAHNIIRDTLDRLPLPSPDATQPREQATADMVLVKREDLQFCIDSIAKLHDARARFRLEKMLAEAHRPALAASRSEGDE